MAQDRRKALDDRTRKLSGGRIEDGKEHAAYQEAQQQLLAIQAEQQQNLAVARAESKASFENNQTLAQAAELGAISAAEAEQMAQAGGQVTLNPATQSVLAKYGVGQPKFSRTQSHSQQVTKQNITINNNVTSNTTNDVKVPGGVGGPLAGRPLQFKDPQTAGQSSTNKFKVWISQAFARQNEEGAKRDREYRNRENSLSKSANRMMKRLEDVGKTIGTRMDPRKIGSTWQSQLKTLLLLFGFGYLTSNWTKVLDTVASIEEWVKGTWSYFTEGGFTSSLAGLFGGKPGQPLFDSLKTLFLGNEEEKGLFGHIKQFFSDMWDERAEAVKSVKTPDITNALNDPMNAIKSLFEYLSNILTTAFSGTEGIKKIKLGEAQTNITNKAEEYRVKNSTTDNTYKRKVNGEDTEVEWGTSAFLDEYGHRGYKGISHHMLENGELTSKFGAESSVSQMSELSRLIDNAKEKGEYDTGAISLALSRLSKYAGKQGMIPIKKNHLTSILGSDEISSLVASGDLVRNVPYREVIRPKTEDDYYRNLYGNEYTDPKMSALASYTLNTVGAEAVGGTLGEFRSWGTKMRANGIVTGTAEHIADYFTGKGGTIHGASKMMSNLDDKIKENQNSKYRTEYIRADSPERPGDISTGNIVYLDEISKQGIRQLSSGVLSKGGANTDNISVSPEDINKYEELLRNAANKQIESRKSALTGELEELTKDNKKVFGYYTKSPERIQQIQDQLGSFSVNSEFKNRLGDISELESKNQERDKKRQSDWDNSAAGRMSKNISDKIDQATDYVNEKIHNYTGINIGTQKLTVKQEDRSKYAMKRFMEEGLNKEQAAGIVGNIIKESSLNPSLAHTDNNGLRAGGIVQWNGPRYNAVSKYFGKPVEKVSFEDQLEYLIKELKGEVGSGAQERNGFLKRHGFRRGAPVLEVMKSTTNLQDSVDTFERVFEGSGDFEGWWTNKGKPNAKFHEGDRNKKRFEYASSVYKNSGGDLSNISYVQYNPSTTKSDSTTNNEESIKQEDNPKTFLQILKDKVSEYITGFGGMLSSANDKIEEAVSPITDEAKRLVLKDGKKYGGPITGEFLTYEDYLKNQDNLPDGLPGGLSEADWRNRVYDMTGSMPQDLKPREGKILSKYTKEGETTKVEAKSAEVSQTETPIKNIEKSTPDLLSIIDPENMKKQDDIVKDIRYTVEGCYDILERNLSANIANGMATSTVVDAVNQGTMTSANASRNISRSIQIQQKNSVANAGSLEYSNDSYKDLV